MKIENGYVQIDIEDVWNSLDEKGKYDFLENIAFTNEAWESIVDSLIIDSIIEESVVSSTYNAHIMKARQKLLEHLGKIQVKHFTTLVHELNKAKKDIYELQEKQRNIISSISDNFGAEAVYDVLGTAKPTVKVEYPSWINEETIKKYFEQNNL